MEPKPTEGFYKREVERLAQELAKKTKEYELAMLEIARLHTELESANVMLELVGEKS